jgi:copper homeostasis protein
MTTKTPEERLQALGLTLPAVPAPMANYVPYRLAGHFLYLSGQGPKRPDGSFMVGRLGKDATVEQGYEAARLTGLQLLAVAKAALGDLARVEAVVKLLGMVNAEPGFVDHPKVINGCSDLLVEVFGDAGRHARSAVGMGSLPNGIMVEIEAILMIGAKWGEPMIYEICVDSVAGVRAAKEAGARRVELCADLLEGGITPSLGMIRQARKVIGIDLNVMIRPRGGDFLFNDDEFASMRADVETAKAEGADGVVIGLLTAAGEIDGPRTRELVALARPLSVTFHRAFDVAAEPFRALETLIELGVDCVLTSGQEASVLEGLPLIVELTKRAGDRIVIMPGGGITARNVERIVAAAKPREMHFAALDRVESGMRFRRPHVFMGGELRPPEYDWLETSQILIRSVMAKGSS